MPLSTSSIEHDPILQLCASIKYDSSKIWHFGEFQPGHFCLYGPSYRAPELITQDWNEVLAFYRARPAYVAPQRIVLPKAVRGVDLSTLDFNI